jgi:multiple sugar transport system ATP-binding protein
MIPQLKHHVGQAVVLALRPERIEVRKNTADCVPDWPVEAAVESCEMLGPETILHLVSGGRRFNARIPMDRGVNRREKVCLRFDMGHAQFFDPATERRIG